MSDTNFSLAMSVRDYECDLQGVVNNSVYQNYLEHGRHEFLLERGVDFADLAAKGIDLMVLRVEIDYKSPLRPHDRFHVTCEVVKEGRIKLAFRQQIVKADGTVIVEAKTIGAAIQGGRPMKSLPEIDVLLSE